MKLPTFEYYFCLCLLILAIEAKDYYKILGIRKSATDKEIKKAFREKARILHPDKNPSPDAEQQFSDLAEGKFLISTQIFFDSLDMLWNRVLFHF